MRNSKYRIRVQSLNTLRELMTSVTPSMTKEFQRRNFDVDEVSRWKATQYRSMLLYLGSVILSSIISPDQYQHFLLLHVACRILNSTELAVTNVNHARNFLKTFVILMPTFYGSDSQTMNIHNLIHVSDDVEYMQAPLSEFSAFWGENYIGELKNLVHSRARPLA